MPVSIAITPGEPAGIGPDIVLQLARNDIPASIVCFASPQLMQQRAQLLGINIDIKILHDLSDRQPHSAGSLQVYPVQGLKSANAGTLDAGNANYVLATLQEAVNSIQGHQLDALVTGPVHKGIINQSGIPFTGHTEFLAELTQGTPVMMLAADKLRVALVTTHLPIAQVSQAITARNLEQVIRILHHDLIHHFAISHPEILICGLNPHAGEDGHLGREEIEIMQPVINKLRAENMRLSDPLPADTLFTPRYLDRADAVLSMYHDQGLPVLKHVGFGHAVNITLGLPIIRTSVDHGTALELAGTGKASTGSLQSALDLAIDLATKKSGKIDAF
ncbi:MAG: 4-hydroxythreonine-4-phosphate dehydrogenase PdxA [Gammaproteobacteria bacterium]|nr:4-hydroxythreonine-4-phosphate dehydrogenase PdxA [Gammaproteobacteria bacterium]